MGRRTPCCHPNCRKRPLASAVRGTPQDSSPCAPKAEKQKSFGCSHLPQPLFRNPFAVSFIIAPILYNKKTQNAREIFNNLKPHGVDFEKAKEFGIKTVLASGLPGIYTPITAGEILYRCICEILEERGFEI